MKILHLNTYDMDGGAAIAVLRLHKALLNEKANSWMLVKNKSSYNQNVIQSEAPKFKYNQFKNFINRGISKINNGKNKNLHSYSIFNSNIINKVNDINPSIVNLNWICDDFLSIEQVRKIKFPVLWTMHDFWPFAGAEHYPNDTRFVEGYSSLNYNSNEKFLDIDRWVWKRKLKYKNEIKNVVCTSNWMIEKVKKSMIFKDSNIFYLPCTIDVEKWLPIEKNVARKKLSISENKIVLIFIASNGIRDKRKNFNFIIQMLKNNKLNKKDLEILIVGNDKKNFEFEDYIFRNYTVKYGDQETLINLYSAADLLLMPSKLEAFGQTALEAGLCNTPTIGFNETGLEDIIIHKQSGYLSNHNDLDDFAEGINWCIDKKNEIDLNLGINARNNIIKKFSSKIIAKEFIDICKKVI